MEVLIESTGVQPREGFRLSVSTRNQATGAPRSRLHGGQESDGGEMGVSGNFHPQ
jgi:hypothetical protein